MKTPPTHWPQVYLCVALTTLATLLLELSLTRIFSVVFYYHLAFLAISIALFGLGAGGVFSYVVAGWKAPSLHKARTAQRGRRPSPSCCLSSSFSSRANDLTNLQLAVIYFTTALPFFVSGDDRLPGDLRNHRARQPGLLFRPRSAPPAGCLLLLPLLQWLGGPTTVVCSAMFFAVAARGLVQHGRIGQGASGERRAGPGAGRVPDVQLPPSR